MSTHEFPQLLVWFALISFAVLRGRTVVSADGIITDCNDSSKAINISSNSTFYKNRNLLFSTLSTRANSTTTNAAYSNATIGLNTPHPVYGLFMCRGDATPSICGSCVAEAITSIRSLCVGQSFGMNGYFNCMFKYSSTNFFGQLDTGGLYVFSINNPNVTTNATGFNAVVTETLNKVAIGAASGSWTLKYATAQEGFAPFRTVYALGQCTPDLSPSDCYDCLQSCISVLSNGGFKLSGYVFFSSCNMRFDNSMFYQTLQLAPQPSPSTPDTHTTPITTNSTATNHKGIKLKVLYKALIGVSIGSIIVAIVVVVVFIYPIPKKAPPTTESLEAGLVTDEFTMADSLLYDFGVLQTATNNFSDHNKLGQGGFGVVYKGIMPDGEEVAVKRLSRSSHQGVEQFKNEIVLLAKLQHKNLVRLLGFCLAAGEKLLVYEYVPNNSLDHFLSDPTSVTRLVWSKRYKIIEGIARGMHYLHEDSQLRIIHRDLKASNVLLDSNFNPKVADFGTARIFGVDQTQDNTERVVGTYGYMAPEYVIRGHFSTKSDVYSFGVLVLEILSGKSNSIFQVSGNDEHLMSYAWKVWKEGKPMDFIDQNIIKSCSKEQVLRCMHIGLSCVQNEMDLRPTMASVLLMLNDNSIVLSTPHHPAFIMKYKQHESESYSTSKRKELSVNGVTISERHPR